MPNLVKTESFYCKILPDDCISFSFKEGKLIFAEALATGHINCYFKLAAQFVPQDRPDFYGLWTLVMILNALDVDPGKDWKGPRRWYNENILDGCIPMKVIESKRINLEQFLCIAECNSLSITCVRLGQDSEDSLRQVMCSLF